MQIDERIAWAAGLFEGEGWFSLDKQRVLRVGLSSIDHDVVRSFVDIVQVGGVFELAPRLGRKRAWRWNVHGSGAVAVAERLRPYLHARRLARLDEILAEIATYRAQATSERECPSCREVFSPPFGANAKRTKYCSRVCKNAADLAAYHLRKHSVGRGNEWSCR